jgi:predicted nucleic acid-binding protein
MFILDTHVVSEMRKVRAGKADPNVAAWASARTGGSLFLSAIVVQELEIGVLQIERRDPAQGMVLRAWLTGNVIPAFRDRILPVDLPMALRSAALHVPDPRPFRDGMIAATALVHAMTVVTRNTADFHGTGAKLLNPWEPQAA